MNINKQLEQDSEKYGVRKENSDYFNIEEGNQNVIRILTEGVVYANHYLGKGVKSPICYGGEKGCPIMDEEGKFHSIKLSVKYAIYILDRNDGKVKLATLPYSVMKGIGSLQENPDYSFEMFPMPYDIRITYKKDEAPATMYKVDAIPKLTGVTEQERKKLDEKFTEITPEEFVQKMKDKQIKKDQENGSWRSLDEIKTNEDKNSENLKKEIKEIKEKKEEIQPWREDEEQINPEDIPF